MEIFVLDGYQRDVTFERVCYCPTPPMNTKRKDKDSKDKDNKYEDNIEKDRNVEENNKDNFDKGNYNKDKNDRRNSGGTLRQKFNLIYS